MLSNVSRRLTYAVALLYALLGVLLYLSPARLAPVFAWEVSGFVTMTIGGWCLGNAWLAYISARRWVWGTVYSTLIYLWLFGLGQLAVLLIFRDRLRLEHPLAWLYVVAVGVNAAAAIAGLGDWLRRRPAVQGSGRPFGPFPRKLAGTFVVFVGFLGFYGSMAQIGWPGTRGGIFPETMSLFTLRSFGAFYLSLALAALPLTWERNLEAVLHHGFASYALIVFVLLAAFAHLRLFDFSGRPGGMLYLAVYLIVGVPLFFAFRKFGVGNV